MNFHDSGCCLTPRRLATALILACGIPTAHAAMVFDPGTGNSVTVQGSPYNPPTPTGIVGTIDLNGKAAGVGTQTTTNVTSFSGGTGSAAYSVSVNASATEGIVQGTLQGVNSSNGQGYAAPVDKTGNPITTAYFSTGGYGTPASTGDITVTFSSLQAYFGLLWGSIGDGDFLSFYNGSTLVATVTGVTAQAASTNFNATNGAQGPGGSQYTLINFLNGPAYNKVVFGETGAPSFESANFQYATTNVAAVPEPGVVGLFGVGLAGLVAARRRRVTKAA